VFAFQPAVIGKTARVGGVVKGLHDEILIVSTKDGHFMLPEKNHK
jgi:hypothetical protein